MLIGRYIHWNLKMKQNKTNSSSSSSNEAVVFRKIGAVVDFVDTEWEI